jgi:hypothetical protein
MGKSFKRRISDEDRLEIVKRIERRRYRIGNYLNLLKPCVCGAYRAYEHDGEAICINCQTTQPKENVSWGCFAR